MSSYPELCLQYQVRKPVSSTSQPPLILMLHGYGSNDSDLFSFASELPEEFLIISARAPISMGFGGYAWYSINFEGNSRNFSNLEEAKQSLQIIEQFLNEVLEAFHPDPSRVFFMGFSQGTILSMAFALNHPDRVSHVLALSGYLHPDLIHERKEPGAYQHLDFFVSHGTADQVIPVDWARGTSPYLKGLGIEHQYREYPVGHGVAPQNFFDMLSWIKERI